MYQAYLKVKAGLPDDVTCYKRLDRALDIVQGFGYEITVHPEDSNIYVVKKASTSLLEDNSHQYHVTDVDCDCPDFEKARAGLCKHRLAVKILATAKSMKEFLV